MNEEEKVEEEEEEEVVDEDALAMQQMMGFGGFGSTKVIFCTFFYKRNT